MKILELGLRGVDPNVALCYWDSTLDHDLPNPADSVLWTPQLLGNGQGYVTTGPFANWPTPSVIPEVNRNRLYRTVGTAAGADALYNRQDIERFMQIPTFEKLAVYCQDPTFEILHGGGHDFVGGHMTYLATSPNDPVFFLHHTFIDYVWEMWRQKHQNLHQRETEYPPDGPRSCGVLYQSDSQMKPFDMKNKDGLGNNYHSLYTYAPSPTCGNGLCSGDYLFCNTNTGFCSAKVRPGGDCTNLEQFDSCFNSACVNGRCTQSDVLSVKDQRPNAVEADDTISLAVAPAVSDDPVATAASIALGVVTSETATEQSKEQDTDQRQQPDTLFATENTDSSKDVITVTESLS
uniref:Tyrosinase copper-binding domain-containing protein n=1 Tax=Romanomermis culicivorax TaxID=13658 RepID=A0A915HZG7_ROMCU